MEFALQRGVLVASIAAGGTCGYAVTTAGQLFFWGKTKNTGEATMYPKVVEDLRGWKALVGLGRIVALRHRPSTSHQII